MEETIKKLKEEEQKIREELSKETDGKIRMEMQMDIKRIQEVVARMEEKQSKLEKQKMRDERKSVIVKGKIKDAEPLMESLRTLQEEKAKIEKGMEVEKDSEIKAEMRMDLSRIEAEISCKENKVNMVKNICKISEKDLTKPVSKPDDKPDQKPDEKPEEKPADKPDQKPDEKPEEKPVEKPIPKKITPSNPEGLKPLPKLLPPTDETKRKGFVSRMLDKVKQAGAFIIDRVKKLPDFTMKFLMLNLDDDEIFDEDLAGQVQGIMEEENTPPKVDRQADRLVQLMKEESVEERRRKEPALEAMHKRREAKRNMGSIPDLTAKIEDMQKAASEKYPVGKSWELPNGEKLKVVEGTNQVGQEAAIKEALATYDRDSRYPIESRRTGGRELGEQ